MSTRTSITLLLVWFGCSSPPVARHADMPSSPPTDAGVDAPTPSRAAHLAPPSVTLTSRGLDLADATCPVREPPTTPGVTIDVKPGDASSGGHRYCIVAFQAREIARIIEN